MTSYFLPRDLHPAAWWVWALGLAVAATRTTNPWLLLTIIAVAGYVVVARRSEAPWALAFRLYLVLGAWIVAIRVFFRLVFGGAEGSTIILRLPEIPLRRGRRASGCSATCPRSRCWAASTTACASRPW